MALRFRSNGKIRTASIAVSLAVLSSLPPSALPEPETILSPDNLAVELKAQDLALRERLKEKIREVEKKKGVGKKIVAEGRRRTILCNVCHGEDGNSVLSHAPNLAGQNPVYLVDQFQRFGDGRRYEYAMSTLAKVLTEEEKVMLALYYAGFETRAAGGGTAEQIERGKAVYAKACAECHGADGLGEKGYARLAGQQPEYVVNMIEEFRNRSGKRLNQWMTAVSLHLSEENITDVAFYVANMK